jgi:hypothetical protein
MRKSCGCSCCDTLLSRADQFFENDNHRGETAERSGSLVDALSPDEAIRDNVPKTDADRRPGTGRECRDRRRTHSRLRTRPDGMHARDTARDGSRPKENRFRRPGQ